MAATALCYAPVRFAMDFLRIHESDNADPRYGHLTPAQWACVALFAFGLVMIAHMQKIKASVNAQASAAPGQPLVFEKTISFSPFASDGPPLYKDDCLPDPPVFSNPFAWDGKSVSEPAAAKPIEKPDPQAMEDCLKQLPQDSIEAETARDRRLMEQWGWRASQPAK